MSEPGGSSGGGAAQVGDMSNDELNEHRTYYDDAVKLSRYREAISATVKPGDVVLDLGAGTGLLGFLAAQAGAARVYAVDGGAIITVVGELAKANGLGDVVVPLRALSTKVELPEKVDVIVGDQLGGMGFDAGVNDYYADAARRLLRPGGKAIPERYVIGLAPAEAPEEFAAIDFWGEREGFDLRPVRSYAANSVRPVRFTGDELLGPTVPVVELETTEDVDIDVRGQLTISRAGVLHGLVGSFRATMSPGVEMTNDPSDPDRMRHRWQDFLPLAEAVDVSPGDVVEFRLKASPKTLAVSWQVTVVPHGGGEPTHRGRHSTMAGTFADPSELRERRPDRPVPVRTERLEETRRAIELLATAASIADVEAALAKEFPASFSSGDDATLLVRTLADLIS